MAAAVARHDALLDDCIRRYGGIVFSNMGDGVAAAFGTARGAVAAAVDAQRALASEPWAETGPLRARMGVHTGEGRVVGDQYESHTLNRCARLMAAAHGGQLVISGSTEELVRGDLPPGVELVDLGEHRLRDLQTLMHVFQVLHPELESEFGALRTVDPARRGRPSNLPAQLDRFVGRVRRAPGHRGSPRLARACSRCSGPVAPERPGWRSRSRTSCATASTTACTSWI